MSETKPVSKAFYVTRAQFTDFFVIHTPTPEDPNATEELDVDETHEWFRVRGADMPSVERGLDHIWNFAKGLITIANYKEPPVKDASIQPRL
jgi:hypothetical protein